MEKCLDLRYFRNFTFSEERRGARMETASRTIKRHIIIGG